MDSAAGAASRGRRLTFWFIFAVLASVVPLFWTYSYLVDIHAPHSLSAVLSRGDLIVISTVLAAGSVGEMITRKTKSGISTFEGVMIGITVLLLMCGGWLYAIVSHTSPDGGQLAVLYSVGTFVASLVVGTGSIWVDSR
jgi:hypothetical protein